MNHKTYRSCAVPQCKNTSKKTPSKLFVGIPKTEKMRNKWLRVARRDPAAISAKSTVYYCEDHFDLPEDMENYMQYHVMGSVTQVRMKPDVIPTRFACQLDRKKRTTNKERPYFLKKQRKSIIEDCERDMAEKSKAEKRLEPVGVTLESVQDVGKIEIKEEAVTVKIEYEVEPAPTTVSTTPQWANKSVQVYRTHKFRSKAVQTESKPTHGSKGPAKTYIEILPGNTISTCSSDPVMITHDSPSEDSEVEIQRLAKKLTAALTTISVLTKKNGDLTKNNQELAKRVAALEQKNKVMGRQQAVLQKLNEGLARRSLLVEQRSERLRARVVAHGIADAMTDDEEGDEEEPRPPAHTHPHPGTDTEETETADEDWTMSQDSSPEQTDTTSKTRPKPLSNLLRVSHQRNVKIVNIPSTSKLYKSRKTSNTTRGKRSRHNSVTNKNARMETCVEPLVEETRFDEVVSEQADPLSLMTPGDIKIEDDIKIEEPDIEEYIAMTERI